MKDSTHPQPSSQGEPKEDILQEVTQGDYKYGFETKISTETIERGLSEEVVRLISKRKSPSGFSTSVSKLTSIGSH